MQEADSVLTGRARAAVFIRAVLGMAIRHAAIAALFRYPRNSNRYAGFSLSSP